MDRMDHFKADISYDEVVALYGNIFDQWDRKSTSGIPATLAVAGDGGMLHPAAELKYIATGRAKIVIFGHTHQYELESGPDKPPRAVAIYANCGTWIDAKPCTFLVTEQCHMEGEDRLYVRGYQYTLSQEQAAGIMTGPLDEAYIVV